MALTIIDDCIGCGACEPECPNNAISEAQDLYVIDPDHCTECYGFYASQQCADVCPVESCIEDREHPEGPQQLEEKFHILYPEKTLENTEKWNPPIL